MAAASPEFVGTAGPVISAVSCGYYRTVAGLPAGQRRAVALYYYADLPASQITEPAGAARASLHRARLRGRFAGGCRCSVTCGTGGADLSHRTRVRPAAWACVRARRARACRTQAGRQPPRAADRRDRTDRAAQELFNYHI